jgi:DNA-binding NtrC family response regulator
LKDQESVMQLQTFDRCWIMVVADDLATREVLMDVLNIADFPTVGVATAREAAEWLKSADPDPMLLVLEGEQNVLDGVQLRDLQQPNPRQRQIHVVVLAPPDENPTLHRDAIPEAITMLPKPINLDGIVALATQHCVQKRR